MPEKNYGGSAFPVADTDSEGRSVFQEGMSLRDYFAAKAMQGIVIKGVAMLDKTGEKMALVPSNISIMAYEIADAMIKERNQTT